MFGKIAAIRGDWLNRCTLFSVTVESGTILCLKMVRLLFERPPECGLFVFLNDFFFVGTCVVFFFFFAVAFPCCSRRCSIDFGVPQSTTRRILVLFFVVLYLLVFCFLAKLVWFLDSFSFSFFSEAHFLSVPMPRRRWSWPRHISCSFFVCQDFFFVETLPKLFVGHVRRRWSPHECGFSNLFRI